MRDNESGQGIVEYALLIGVIAVALIPVPTAFTVTVNRYFEKRTDEVEESNMKIAKAQDLFIQYMDERIAYMQCLVDLKPSQGSSACGSPP